MQSMRWDVKFSALTETLKISKADLERKAKSDELAAAGGGDAPGGDKPKRRRTISRLGRHTNQSTGLADVFASGK